MIHRLIHLPTTHSYFLFGARGTGKTTLLRNTYSKKNTCFIDLLDLKQETQFIKDPELLGRMIDALADQGLHRVVIDEIQKAPNLLNVVHRKIEETKRLGAPVQFIMTGSSARKLRHGSANLLAGRAFVYHLFPLTVSELGAHVDLRHLLEYGSLPEVWTEKDADAKIRFLEAYTRTYLKEEIWNEQIIRKIEPFSHFLEVAAQMNGKVLNFSKIGRDISSDTKTVQAYFQILEDTLLGFLIPAYRPSFRRRHLTNPKFYFFDTGVKRALEGVLTVPLLPQTSAFGDAFEHFILLEIKRRNEYLKRDYRFSYFQTHDGAEIDLVIERPGKPIALVEIKSSQRATPEMIKHLERFSKEFKTCESYCLSQDPNKQKMGNTRILPWQDGLISLGL